MGFVGVVALQVEPVVFQDQRFDLARLADEFAGRQCGGQFGLVGGAHQTGGDGVQRQAGMALGDGPAGQGEGAGDEAVGAVAAGPVGQGVV